MKKLFLFLVVMISVSNLALAQNEVRGVETKLAKYEGPRYSAEGDCYLWFGFQFTNFNSIPVSVDVELYRSWNSSCEDKLITTKTFVIEPKETYIWKFEHNDDFRVYYSYSSDIRRGYDRIEKETIRDQHRHYTYYVRYKAYKLE